MNQMKANSNSYGVLKQEYELGGICRISYGIVVYDNSAEDDSAVIIDTIADVSEDYAKISELVGLCNENELSVLHIRDVIEDFLCV